MSRMMRSDRKPPLARSPIRLRSRGNLQSTTSIPVPPAAAQTPLVKPQIAKRTWDAEEMKIRPEYNTISSELRALAKMVQGGSKDAEMEENSVNVKRSPLFERGRFYEEYSARRNERLRRKKGVFEDKTYDLGVRVTSAKKTDAAKKLAGARKTVPATPITERGQMSRYSLRSNSCKENNKPPVVPVSYDKSVGMSARKVTVRRTRKI